MPGKLSIPGLHIQPQVTLLNTPTGRFLPSEFKSLSDWDYNSFCLKEEREEKAQDSSIKGKTCSDLTFVPSVISVASKSGSTLEPCLCISGLTDHLKDAFQLHFSTVPSSSGILGESS